VAAEDVSVYKTRNGFMILVGRIGVDASIANMVKPAGGSKAFRIGTFIPFKTYVAWWR